MDRHQHWQESGQNEADVETEIAFSHGFLVDGLETRNFEQEDRINHLRGIRVSMFRV